MSDETRKKPGPLPGPDTVRTNVLVEPDLLDWAKRQPGGFSRLVRDLLREERRRRVGKSGIASDVANEPHDSPGNGDDEEDLAALAANWGNIPEELSLLAADAARRNPQWGPSDEDAAWSRS